MPLQSRRLHLCNHLSLDTLPRTIRDHVATRIKSVQSKFPRFHPQLAIIQAGSREDSTTYIRMKRKAAEELGIKTRFIHIPVDVTTNDALEIVKNLNDDEQVNGILVQLPLGNIGSDGERVVTEAISPEKDVDG
jgi:methylenetetrahydrofolate dehydrogenase (NADP+) / methenyltetrahydrofolate cyclohydrolase / formyltetrahydrofolate synthetase